MRARSRWATSASSSRKPKGAPRQKSGWCGWGWEPCGNRGYRGPDRCMGQFVILFRGQRLCCHPWRWGPCDHRLRSPQFSCAASCSDALSMVPGGSPATHAVAGTPAWREIITRRGRSHEPPDRNTEISVSITVSSISLTNSGVGAFQAGDRWCPWRRLCRP